MNALTQVTDSVQRQTARGEDGATLHPKWQIPKNITTAISTLATDSLLGKDTLRYLGSRHNFKYIMAGQIALERILGRDRLRSAIIPAADKDWIAAQSRSKQALPITHLSGRSERW